MHAASARASKSTNSNLARVMRNLTMHDLHVYTAVAKVHEHITSISKHLFIRSGDVAVGDAFLQRERVVGATHVANDFVIASYHLEAVKTDATANTTKFLHV